MSANQEDDNQGMSYLDTVSNRWVTVYIPLAIFVFVLLFPFLARLRYKRVWRNCITT